MIMKRTSVGIFAALVFTSAPFAIGQAAAQQPAGSPHQLDSFVGDGTCSGNMTASGKNPAHATTGKFHGEITLDGHWAVIQYDEDKTAANPKPFSVAQYVGYDAAKKQLVTVLFDNSGSSYGTGVSTGWKGDTITFDETVTMDGKPGSFRDVFTNGASGMSSHTGMMRDKDGKWVKTDVETCHKP
jgi:hypothetical protein